MVASGYYVLYGVLIAIHLVVLAAFIVQVAISYRLSRLRKIYERNVVVFNSRSVLMGKAISTDGGPASGPAPAPTQPSPAHQRRLLAARTRNAAMAASTRSAAPAPSTLHHVALSDDSDASALPTTVFQYSHSSAQVRPVAAEREHSDSVSRTSGGRPVYNSSPAVLRGRTDYARSPSNADSDNSNADGVAAQREIEEDRYSEDSGDQDRERDPASAPAPASLPAPAPTPPAQPAGPSPFKLPVSAAPDADLAYVTRSLAGPSASPAADRTGSSSSSSEGSRPQWATGLTVVREMSTEFTETEASTHESPRPAPLTLPKEGAASSPPVSVPVPLPTHAHSSPQLFVAKQALPLPPVRPHTFVNIKRHSYAPSVSGSRAYASPHTSDISPPQPPPTVGRVQIAYHGMGLICSILQLVRMVDCFAVEGIYPDWFIRVISNVVALIQFVAGAFIVHDFIRIRFASVFTRVPRRLIVLITIVTLVTTGIVVAGLTVRSVMDVQWAAGLYFAWWGVSGTSLILIYDVSIILLSRKIRAVASALRGGRAEGPAVSEDDIESGRVSPRSPRKAHTEANLSSPRRNQGAGRPPAMLIITPAQPRNSGSIANSVMRSVSTFFRRADMSSPSKPINTGSFEVAVQNMRKFAAGITFVVVTGSCYAIYFGVNQMVTVPFEPNPLNDPNDPWSAMSDLAPILIEVGICLVALWYAYLPFGYLRREFWVGTLHTRPDIASAMASAAVGGSATPSGALQTPRLSFHTNLPNLAGAASGKIFRRERQHSVSGNSSHCDPLEEDRDEIDREPTRDLSARVGGGIELQPSISQHMQALVDGSSRETLVVTPSSVTFDV